MDLEQKYKVVYVTDLQKSLDFFLTKLGLKLHEHLDIPGRDRAVVLQMFDGDFLMLLQNEELEKVPVLLYTDDCLRDHYRLSVENVVGLTAPMYSPEGVTIAFPDPCGNKFILLEKRDYTDT